MAKIGRARRANRAIFQSIEPLESRVLLSTIVVNTTSDGTFSPGTGLVSLRSAIAAADTATNPTTIIFDPGVFATPQTIVTQGSRLVIDATQPVAIIGPAVGVILDGNGLGDVLHINQGSVSLSHLTLTDGSDGIAAYGSALTVSDLTVAGNMGGIYNDHGTASITNATISGNTAWGGFANGGPATVADSTISDNTSTVFSGGGGIYNSSDLVLDNVTLSDNTTSGDGGGIDNNSGYRGGTLTLSGVTISHNQANHGGGIDNEAGGIMVIGPATIDGNNATSDGGGVSNAGTATLTGVLLTGNTASYGGGINNNGSLTLTNDRIFTNAATYGGGISGAGSDVLNDVTLLGNVATWGAGINSNGSAALTNVSIQNNHGRYGGGMDNGGGTANLNNVTFSANTAINGGGFENSNGTAILTNVTVSQNTADYGAGIDNGGTLTLTNCTVDGNTANLTGGGLYSRSGFTSTLSNTIMAQNALGGPSVSGADASGSINSLGYNLIGATDGSTGWNAFDLTGTTSKPLDPKLSPLGNYGGPTQSMALLPGSPALDAGWNALAVDANDNPLTTDQRGLPRIYGSSVDIGAYEAQPPALGGDVNHDGSVNLSDLLLLTRDFGKTTPMFESGDLDGDGNVGIFDFLILSRNFGKAGASTASSSVSSASTQSPATNPDDLHIRAATRRASRAAALRS